jgi:hypothetical protein
MLVKKYFTYVMYSILYMLVHNVHPKPETPLHVPEALTGKVRR